VNWEATRDGIRATTYRMWDRDAPDPEIERRLHEFFAEYGPVRAYPRSLTNMYPIHLRGERWNVTIVFAS